MQIIFLQLLRDVLEDHECMEQLCNDQKDDVSGSVGVISLSLSDKDVSDKNLSETITSSPVEGIRRAHNESAVLWDLLHTIGDQLLSLYPCILTLSLHYFTLFNVMACSLIGLQFPLLPLDNTLLLPLSLPLPLTSLFIS